MGDKLSPKQERFCQEYLVDLNATKAAERSGYSSKTAEQQGYRLLRNVQVGAKLQQLMDARAKRVEVTADEILRELLIIAKADISKAFDSKTGKLLPVHEMPEEVRRCISGIETQDLFAGRGEDREQVGMTHKVRFWPKTAALELLGRHLKIFTDKIEHSGRVDVADRLKKARERSRTG